MHTVAVKVTVVQPLWSQVLEDLHRRLAEGEFSDRFPGDADLVAHYGVSRHTVREAVRRLQADGLLDRRRGQGSFLTHAPIEQPIGKPYSLYRSVDCAREGQESIVRVLEIRSDDLASVALGCPGEPLLYLERLRLADGLPLAIDRSWLPAVHAQQLKSVDFRRASLCDELARLCGVRLTSGWERIRPALPEPHERELLEVGARQPAFAIERLAYAGTAAMEWRQSLVRGDRFSFVARWSSEHFTSDFD